MTDTSLSEHYTPHDLLGAIDAGLSAAGADPHRPDLSVLKPVDEFHTGGVEATEALLDPLGIVPGSRVVDIGSGIGGTARLLASRYGAEVTGVDQTPAFVETAQALSTRTGPSAQTRFVEGNALDLPLPDAEFDLATMLHVGMNIEDKAALFREVARVLVPGGRFALFDIMRGRAAGEIRFPVPWAPDPAHSFVDPPEIYRAAGEAAGLTLVAERDRSEFAVVYFQKVIAALDRDGPPRSACSC